MVVTKLKCSSHNKCVYNCAQNSSRNQSCGSLYISTVGFVFYSKRFNFSPQGLSLINGTQFITAIGAEAIFRAEQITKQADVIAALSLEVLQGTPRAFDLDVHANRPHPGQQKVASRLRALLDSNIHPSEIRGETVTTTTFFYLHV